MYPRSMPPLEQAVVRAALMLLPALLASIVLLAVPFPDDPLWLVIGHLSALVAFGVVLAVRLAPLARHGEWFRGTNWSPPRRRLAGAVAVVVVVSGAVALLTLASSAALRLQPSLQFLQLLSALDIAWAAAAIVVGAELRWGRVSAWGGGLVLGVFCVFSLWRYLDVVGFTENGGWRVSGTDLWRYVIPSDMAAAVAALIVLGAGVRSPQRIEQAKLQS